MSAWYVIGVCLAKRLMKYIIVDGAHRSGINTIFSLESTGGEKINPNSNCHIIVHRSIPQLWDVLCKRYVGSTITLTFL